MYDEQVNAYILLYLELVSFGGFSYDAFHFDFCLFSSTDVIITKSNLLGG